MTLPAHPVRSATATRVVLAAILGGGLLAGCGGSDASELGADELRAAIEEDAKVVDERTREIAPDLAEALDGRVLGAYGNVEACNGGSFDGATAYGYQVSGRVVGFRAPDPLAAAEEVASALEEAGWSRVDARETAPGRVGAEGSLGRCRLGVTFNDEVPGAFVTLRGRCLPVTDEGREAVTDLSGAREVIAKR